MFLDNETKLSVAVAKFYDRYPLYFCILSSIGRIPDPKEKTFSVGFTKNNSIALYYNPDYLEKESVEKVCAHLAHQCSHLCLEHIARQGMKIPEFWNLAADVMVDTSLQEIEQEPGKFPEFLGKKWVEQNLPFLKDAKFDELSTEDLYTTIQANLPPPQQQANGKPGPGQGKGEGDSRGGGGGDKDESQEPGKGDGENQESKDHENEDHGGPDSHERWKDHPTGGQNGRDGLTEQQRAMLEQLVRDTVAQMDGRYPGNIPGELRRKIEEYLKCKKDWRGALSLFVQSVVKEERRYTWKKVNRRFFNGKYSTAPGRRWEYKPRILIAIDNSGSIDLNTYALFMAHITKIGAFCEELDVIGCDTRVNFVHKSLKFKRGTTKPPDLKDWQSGGGTLFQPVFDHARSGKYDGVIYFTDGYNFDDGRLNTFKIPTIFAVIPPPNGKQVANHRNIVIED